MQSSQDMLMGWGGGAREMVLIYDGLHLLHRLLRDDITSSPRFLPSLLSTSEKGSTFSESLKVTLFDMRRS